MPAVGQLTVQLLLLLAVLGVVLWLSKRPGLIALFRANGGFGYVAVGFAFFSALGLILHQNLTGVVPWGAIQWLLAILAGGIVLLIWGASAVVRDRGARARISTLIFLALALIAPLWLGLNIMQGG